MPNNINLLQSNFPSTNIDSLDSLKERFAEERQAFFNCLTKEQQLLVFCEVINKLVKAELIDRVSYRGVLYGEFQFDNDAEFKAKLAGFLDLHNSIDAEKINLGDFGSALLKLYGIEQNKDEVLEKIRAKENEMEE